MTREEAINRLKAGEPFSEICDPTWDEAVNMAISALSENKRFDGMTNGEVIEALFPNTTFKDAFIDTFAEITFVGTGYALLKKEWLESLYKAEEKNNGRVHHSL